MHREPLFLDDDILPPPPAGAVPVLHDREYRIESYRLAADRLLLQGALRDQKPPGLFIPDDPEPLTIHHMTLELEIVLPGAMIDAVRTAFPAHPNPSCPSIIGHYDELIGLSIARGFTHRVRELFGGPRGCSHTTALLQAMAPIAMQSMKSMEIAAALEADEPHPLLEGGERRDGSWERLINTCHVWAEDGQQVELIRRGGAHMQPLTMTARLTQLGDAGSNG